MKTKPGIDGAGAPVIVLAGQEWIIPVLAIRQNRIVVPRLRKLIPLLGRAARDPLSAELMSADCLAANEELMTEGVVNEIVLVLHAALTRAYEITLEEFLDLEIAPHEWVGALGVVIQQTQFFKTGGGRVATAGEDETTTATST